MHSHGGGVGKGKGGAAGEIAKWNLGVERKPKGVVAQRQAASDGGGAWGSDEPAVL